MTLKGAEKLEHSKTGLTIKDAARSGKNVDRPDYVTKRGKTLKLATPADAVHEIDNEFGSWGPAAICLFAGHLAWLLKEVFWIFLIPYPAMLFGCVALALFVVAFAIRLQGGEEARFYQEGPVELLINMIHISWQIFNLIQLIVSFMYEEPDETPGYAEDLVNLSDCDEEGPCWDTFKAFMMVVRVGFCLTFVLWVCSSVYLLYKWLTPPNLLAQGYAFQTCMLQGGWIAFWVLKDFAWTFDDGDTAAIVSAMACYSVHFLILLAWLVTTSSRIVVVDGIDPEEMEKFASAADAIFDRSNTSYLIWSFGSLFWCLCELCYDDDVALRYVAGSLCSCSFLVYASSYNQVKAKANLNDLFIRKLREMSVEGADPSTVGKPAWDPVLPC